MICRLVTKTSIDQRSCLKGLHSDLRATPLRAASDTSSTTDIPGTLRVAKPTLFDIPVSNHGARVRFVIYKKGLDVHIQPPTTIGGLRSEQYLACNPQGKMPLLVLPGGAAIPESEVIVQYLLRACHTQGPSLVAPTPELQVKSDLATRIMDCYINAIQGCLYKDMDIETRAAQIGQIAKQLDVLEGVIEGPFVAGQEITSGDGCLIATIAWLEYILPTKFHWQSIFTGRPKLAAWWDAMQADPAGRQVTVELQKGLRKWDQGGRWEERGIAGHVADSRYQWSY